MAQSGGSGKRKFKDKVFYRKVVLVENGCISFSDMNKNSKSEIEFSSSMTQNDVQKKIQEKFPYLEDKSFSCAASVKVDNDLKRFEYHGPRRVWDGKTIMKQIRGKSNLYILEGEVTQPTSTVTHGSNSTGVSGFINTGNLEASQADGTTNLQNSLMLVMSASSLEQGDQAMSSQQGFNVMSGCSTDNKYTVAAAPEAQVEISDCRSRLSDDDYISPTSGMSESDLEYSEKKSEECEQVSSSTASEGDNKADVNPSSSDTGFDEIMDISSDEPSNFSVPAGLPISQSLDAIKTEEGPFPPFSSQMFDTSMLDSALEEFFSDSVSDDMSDDMDLLGGVHDIIPTSGPMKGGYQFNITLTEQLSDDVTWGIAKFEGVADVQVHKLNPFTLTGKVPCSLVPGDVPVTVTTEAGQVLGMTCFKYVDDMLEMVKQLVQDPAKQSLWFVYWSQENGFSGSDSYFYVPQVFSPLNMPDQVQAKQQQSVKVLQLLVYTAAQTDARQFIEMIFSTSAGQIVFNSYKGRTPLPEDIARANGHDDLAELLQDINTRLSQETNGDVQSNAIDWLELAIAVQKQAFAIPNESNKQMKHPCEDDDNSSDYFADDETSSCGSFDLDTEWSDSEDEDHQDWYPGTSAHSSHQTGEQCDSVSASAANTEPTQDLFRQILALQSPMESSGNEQGVSGCTDANSFHTNGAPDVQMTALTLEQDRPSVLSFNKRNIAREDQTQEFDSIMPASSLTDENTEENTATPGVQIEVSGQCSWSLDFLTTSGTSDHDDMDSSERVFDGTITGNYEICHTNGEPDLQNWKQGQPSALSFNKENVADQHQGIDMPGSSTDNTDIITVTASPEAGQVEVSGECSSSSKEECFTTGVLRRIKEKFSGDAEFRACSRYLNKRTSAENRAADGLRSICWKDYEVKMTSAVSFAADRLRWIDCIDYEDKMTSAVSFAGGAFIGIYFFVDQAGATLGNLVNRAAVQKEISEAVARQCGIGYPGKRTSAAILAADAPDDGLIKRGCKPISLPRLNPAELWLLSPYHSTLSTHSTHSTYSYTTGCQKESRKIPVSLLLRGLKRTETDLRKLLSLPKRLSTSDEAVDDDIFHLLNIILYDSFLSDDNGNDLLPKEKEKILGLLESILHGNRISPLVIKTQGVDNQTDKTKLLDEALFPSPVDEQKHLYIKTFFLKQSEDSVQLSQVVDGNNKNFHVMEREGVKMLHWNTDEYTIIQLADFHSTDRLGIAQAAILLLGTMGFIAPEIRNIGKSLREEAFERDCPKERAAALVLQKEVYHHLHLLIRKFCSSSKGKGEKLSTETLVQDH